MADREIKFRCWIYVDGERFFGPGRMQLLGEIEKSGSISRAAKAMGMSYKKAWEMVEQMNAKSTVPYVVTQKGGSGGGGTQLTEAAKRLMKEYDDLVQKLENVVEKNADILNTIC